jgi:hypothetical protein
MHPVRVISPITLIVTCLRHVQVAVGSTIQTRLYCAHIVRTVLTDSLRSLAVALARAGLA